MAPITFQLQRTQIQGQVVKFEQIPEEVSGDVIQNQLPTPVLHPMATLTLDQLQEIADGDDLPAILEFTVDVPA